MHGSCQLGQGFTSVELPPNPQKPPTTKRKTSNTKTETGRQQIYQSKLGQASSPHGHAFAPARFSRRARPTSCEPCSSSSCSYPRLRPVVLDLTLHAFRPSRLTRSRIHNIQASHRRYMTFQALRTTASLPSFTSIIMPALPSETYKSWHGTEKECSRPDRWNSQLKLYLTTPIPIFNCLFRPRWLAKSEVFNQPRRRCFVLDKGEVKYGNQTYIRDEPNFAGVGFYCWLLQASGD
ncbi:hypothetical protein BZA77DRAFT_30845 [Pyronema omphalodes]|nr:hypothetical protein BZA77DRAFT_30845 [Pyronema omphalodes]